MGVKQRLRSRLGRRFARDASGAAIVEFAFLSAILFGCIATAVDLTTISGFNRDIERTTTQVANIVTSCPSSDTPGFTSCITDTINQYVDRVSNTFIRYPTITIYVLQISKVGGAIKVCTGRGTFIEPDVAARAVSVMSDNDTAIAAVMSMTYTPIFRPITSLFTGSNTSTLRGYTIAIQLSNSVACIG